MQPFLVDMGKTADIVKVGNDAQGVSVFWATDTGARQYDVSRQFLVVGTGAEIPEEYTAHRGTWITGRFEWHLMEKV